ncbi:MAG: lysophospholipid acyltransferase family protein, partial [Ardenticatenaceae bacterium]
MRFLVATLMRVRVEGLSNVPEGAALLAANHLGHADPAVTGALLREPPEVIALSELREAPVAPLMWLYAPITVRRDEIDRDVLRATLAALRRGEKVFLCPEAHISRTGALEQAREGIGYLALHAGVPVVPVAITGTERLAAEWKRLRRPPVTVTFAPPIVSQHDPGLPRRAQRHALTQQVMCAIAAHLPPPYRGVYASALDSKGLPPKGS